MKQLEANTTSTEFEFTPADFGQPEDRDLTRRIVSFLLTKGLLHGAQLVLRVQSGHVELRGTVASFRHRHRLDSFVSRVAGVHQVINQTVVGTPFSGLSARFAAADSHAVAVRD